MNVNTYNFRSVLTQKFEQRRKNNSAYSLRAFARDLGVSPTALSQVINSKRKFSIHNARKVAHELGLVGAEAQKFLVNSSYNAMAPNSKTERKSLSEDQFILISDWYYFAIMNLAKIKNCRADPRWIAQRLNLDFTDAKFAVQRLVRMNLVEVKGDRLFRTSELITTTEDVQSKAIQIYHRQRFDRFKAALENVEVERREILSLTFPMSSNRIKELKNKIRRFADSLADFAEGDRPDEVYTIGVDLVPLSHPIK